MTMTARAFVDTNVVLQSTISSVPRYRQALSLIESQEQKGVELWISRQILREYASQISRPQTFMSQMTTSEVITQIRYLQKFYYVADETAAVTERLLDLIQMYPTGGEQIHDANIVATMLVHEIDTLLTFNVDDMKRFSPKVTLISSSEDFPQDNVVE